MPKPTGGPWDVTGRGISAQAFNLVPKIRELRDALAPDDFAPDARPRAVEVHPERQLRAPGR